MWPLFHPLLPINTTSSNICTCFSRISGSSLPSPWTQSPRDLPLRLWCMCWHQSDNNHSAAAESLQSCPTLCDPIDSSPPGSSVPGILQARILEWVAISFSNAWKWKVKVKSLSRARLLATPWTAAYQAPPSVGFSRQRVLEWGAIAFSVWFPKRGK